MLKTIKVEPVVPENGHLNSKLSSNKKADSDKDGDQNEENLLRR